MLSEGQVLENKYRVDRLLARGGMGAVFVGQHMRIKRKVAIKVLHIGDGQNDALRRFEKEAQAAGQIGSDHIVEVLDIGSTAEGDRFMVMEFLDGEPLKQRIKSRGKLPPNDAVPIIIQLLEGLAAAHDVNIIHRDLKPDNIFLLREKAGRRDFVKIVDFGISKFGSLAGEAGELTQAGAVMGTPFYMSPEQARSANEADARSDLYSVGVILYQVLSGVLPFQAGTFAELLFKIVFEAPPHLQAIAPEVDNNLSAIVMKAMAREPADRYASARELQRALERWLASAVGMSRTNVHNNLFAPVSPSLADNTELPRFEDPTLNLDSSPGLPPVPTPSWTGQHSYPSLSQSQSHLAQSQSQLAQGGQGLMSGHTPPSMPSYSSPGQPWTQNGPDLSQSGSLSSVHQSPAPAPGPANLDTQKSWDTPGQTPMKGNRVVGFAIIGAFAVVGAVAAFFITRSDPPPAVATPSPSAIATETAAPEATQAAPTPTTPTPPAPEPSAEEATTPSVEPTASAAPEPSAEPTATTRPTIRRPPVTTAPTTTTKPTTTTTATTKPPAPAGSTVKDFGY